jgi:hypothetical protein
MPLMVAAGVFIVVLVWICVPSESSCLAPRALLGEGMKIFC